MNFRKHAEKDFDNTYLPHNRKEVFFDTLKLRFGLYLKIGLLLFLFVLPLLAVKLYGEILYTSNYSEYADDLEKARIVANNIKVMIALFEIPCFIILGIGLAGILRVIRQLIWQEGIFFLDDFKTGVKMNAKVYIITAVIASLLNVYIKFVPTISTSYQILLYVPVGVVIVFFIPIMFYILTQSQIYNNKYMTFVKNSTFFYMKTIWQSLLFSLILVSLIFLDLISLIILKYVLIFLIIVFIMPFFLSIRFLFDCSIYDKYINQYDYPDLVDKGVSRL